MGLSKLWKDGDYKDKTTTTTLIQGTPFHFEKIVKASQVSQNVTVLQVIKISK